TAAQENGRLHPALSERSTDNKPHGTWLGEQAASRSVQRVRGFLLTNHKVELTRVNCTFFGHKGRAKNNRQVAMQYVPMWGQLAVRRPNWPRNDLSSRPAFRSSRSGRREGRARSFLATAWRC